MSGGNNEGEYIGRDACSKKAQQSEVRHHDPNSQKGEQGDDTRRGSKTRGYPSEVLYILKNGVYRITRRVCIK